MDEIKLTSANFLLYAMKLYDNPSCFTVEDFNADLKRVSAIRKQFKRYLERGDLCERTVLNQIIVLSNVFGYPGAIKILFYKLEDRYHGLLKTFLVFLGQMPDRIVGVRDRIVFDVNLPIDLTVASKLRKI